MTPALRSRLRSLTTGRRRLPPSAQLVIGLVSLAISAVALARAADTRALADTIAAMVSHPIGVAVAVGAFGSAFALRAGLWRRVLPDLPYGQALAALHLALGANHVLPLRLGEPLRVVSVVRRTRIGLEPAVASTVALRSADIVAMGVLGVVLGPAAFARLVGPVGAAIFAGVATTGLVGIVWLRRVASRRAVVGGDAAAPTRVRLPGPIVAAGSLAAWVLEAVLVWQCAHFAGIELGFARAVLVTTVAVAAQTVAIAPGGLGTYEAASVAAYTSLGVEAGPALAAALTTHALKTAYSLVAGGIAVVHPRPGLFGRLRLHTGPLPDAAADADTDTDTEARSAATGPARAPAAPIVLFLPALDEEATVAAVVATAPAAIAGHPVEVVVVDDGSTDGTADAAEAAGATVVRHDANRGLGAAVRTGLRQATERGAVAVAFCDADGEYRPAELDQLVAPILAGEADYVVGSRFAGEIRHMLPHRRFGNVVLTRLLGFVARRPITDGQSGYRALSADAAAHAEVIHDFNYAQVLTLDLLAKGYRYREVPITYSFRRTGRSFVRLAPYLRRVVPAVYRQVNATPA
jgi:uncharacterized membrane protein YbhN (UPF0104 family)